MSMALRGPQWVRTLGVKSLLFSGDSSMVRPRGKLWGLGIAVAALVVALPAAMRVAADEAAPEHKAAVSEKIAGTQTGGDLGKQETALAWIPDNAAFYVSALHCRQQIDAVRQSKAWDRLMKLPAVVELLDKYQKQSEDSESPAGKVQSGLANPQVQSALNFLADLLGQEAFVCGDPNCIDFLRLYQRINCANLSQTISSAMQGKTGSEGREQQKAYLFHVLAQNADLIKVPNTIAGFRITDKQQARQNLDVVAGFLALGSAMVPELNGRFSRKTVGNCEYLVLSLDGKLIPWDKVPLDELREHEIEKGDIDKVVAKLKGLTLVLAMGLRDDYLVAAAVDSTDVLAALGKGKPLGSRPEFKPLLACADKKLTSISYLSKDLASQVQANTLDLDDLLKQLGDCLGKTDLAEDEQARIRKDAASLAADLKPWLPKAGAKMGFSYLTATGYESYLYDWGPSPQPDPSRALGLLSHVGGDPLAVLIQRDRNDALAYDLLAKVAGMGHYYFDKYALPKLEPESEQEKYKKFESAALPLVARFDAATRKFLLPALADAEGGAVLDAKFTTKQIAAGVPEMEHPMPLPEPALVYGVSDAEALVKAGSEYREVLNGLLAALHESDPDSIPLLAIPEPQVEKSSENTLYAFPLPEKWGVDKRVQVTIGLSKSVLAISANHDQAHRLLASTPLAAGDVLGDASKPRANAGLLRWAALVDAATPWIEEAIRQHGASVPKEANPGDEVIPQVHTVLEVLKTLRTVTCESYADGDALISHAITEIHDVP
jgi:hypothetical protein